jgi:protein SCO1/2
MSVENVMRAEHSMQRAGSALVQLVFAATAGFALLAAAQGVEHHHPQHALPELTRSVANYDLPKVGVMRVDGVRVVFAADIDSGPPVILNFVYTSCTTICPVMTQIFARLQEELGAGREHALLVSVSIDPEYDTVARLAAYAKQFDAGPQWRFYTGSLQASVAIQRAFAVYKGDKMNHTPVTFLRAAPGQPWVRLDGFATPAELLKEYRLLAAPG